MEKILKLYKGVAEFPNKEEQVILKDFKYQSQRMAACPTITASFMFNRCLDNEWSEEVYAEFNGEKYYIKAVPTSSKDNKTLMYKHDLTLYSERFILDNTFFYNAVKAENGTDLVASTTNVTTMCKLDEFIRRINDSLEYSKLGYKVDASKLTKEELEKADQPKQISLDKAFIGTALQEIYNQWDIPYYFNGKTIFLGSGELVNEVFQYGADNSLLSVKKNNQNYKIITRCSGFGGTENIPHYYPNWSPKGIIDAFDLPTNKIIKKNNILIYDMQLYDKKVPLNGIVLYKDADNRQPITPDLTQTSIVNYFGLQNNPEFSCNKVIEINSPRGEGYIDTKFHVLLKEEFSVGVASTALQTKVKWDYDLKETYKHIISTIDFDKSHAASSGASSVKDSSGQIVASATTSEVKYTLENMSEANEGNLRIYEIKREFDVTISFLTTPTKPFSNNGINDYYLSITPTIGLNEDIKRGDFNIAKVSTIIGGGAKPIDKDLKASMPSDYQATLVVKKFDVKYATTQKKGWYINDRKHFNYLSEIGVTLKNISQETNLVGEGFKQEKVGWITPSKTLMPSIYRESLATEIFYNAKNNTYTDEQGNKYVFENEWVLSNQREHIQDFSDIHPTIKGMLNANNQPIDQIIEVAFDDNDNNEVDEEGNYLHPYFYVKIAQTNGTKSFNIFNQKLVGESMKMSFTKGDVAAATFEIQVDTIKDNTNEEYETVINPIQVDDNGNIVKGDWQDKIKEGEPIESQQDSSLGSIWLILKKDNATFNETMPNYPTIVPKANDTFVLLNIKMPRAYVLDAEKRLDDAIIRYMYENNSDKFNFAIDFSRIYLQENPLVTKQLNENCKVKIQYNGAIYELFVNNFTYEVKAKEVLPKISIGLADIITINRSVTQVISDGIMKNVMDIAAPLNINDLNKKYLRKDSDDSTPYNLNVGKLAVERGIESKGSVSTPRVASPKFTNDTLGSGFEMKEDEEGISTLTIDNVIVRRKLQATEFIIQQIQFQGGIVFQTAAGMECSKVATKQTRGIDDYYRCYFDTKNGAVNNQFMINDLARCQRMGYSPKYYWRKVVGIGTDYIDLSINDCDEGSDIPSVGDIIVQLGNTNDVSRQSAIEMNTVGEQAPSFKMYSGINNYSLYLKDVTGIVFDKQEKKPSLYSYGDMFFGDRDKNTYIKYDSSTHQMNIKAQLSVKAPTSTTYDDLDNILSGLDKNITNADNKAVNAQASIDNLQIGGTNILLNSESVISEIAEGNYSVVINKLSQPLEPNKDYVFSIEQTKILKGSPKIFKLIISKTDVDFTWLQTWEIPISDYKQVISIKTPSNTTNKSLILYSIGETGATLGNQLNFIKSKLEEGNKVTTWSPSPSDIKQEIANTEDKLGEDLSNAVATLNGSITNLQNQIDGKVDSWFDNHIPTLNNAPANEWTSESLKKEHEGDTFTNTSQSGEGAGKSWRWYKDKVKGYNWYPITDTDALRALDAARNAQLTADGKATIFTTNDTSLIKNYHIGDMWILPQDKTINNKNYLKGDILTANQESETYVASHWSKEVRYTDDTAAKTAQEIANTASENAAAAAQKAENAKTEATNAKNRLDEWAKDSVISPNEKQSLKDEMARILADKNQINNDYTKYNIGTPTAFNTAYTNYNSELTRLSAKEPETIAIGSNFATYQNNFYTQRTNALNAISQAAQNYANDKANDAATLAVNKIKIGGRNILLNSKEIITTPNTSNYNEINIQKSEILKPSTQYVFSIGSSKLLSGTSDNISFAITKSDTENDWINKWDIPISDNIQYLIVTTSSKVISTSRLLIFNGTAGQTSGVKLHINKLKFEEGNVLTDWTPAPEDIDKDIKEAKESADKASNDVTILDNNVHDAFQDGVITEGERQSILKQYESFTNSHEQLVNEYNDVYNSQYLIGQNKTDFKTAFTTLKNTFDAISPLFKIIKSTNVDYKIKINNKNLISKIREYNTAINNYQSALTTYGVSIQAAEESIRNEMQNQNKNLVDNLTIGGTNLMLETKKMISEVAPQNYYTKRIELSVPLIASTTYMFSVNSSKALKGSFKNFKLIILKSETETNWIQTIDIPISNERKAISFTTPSNTTSASKIGFLIGENGNTLGNQLEVNEFKLELGNKDTLWTPSPNDIDNEINNVKKTADKAKEDLDAINGDNRVTIQEKNSLLQQKKNIESEYSEIIENAKKYGVEYASYTNAKDLAITAINKYTNFKINQLFILIDSDYKDISAYYDARTTIAESIATKTKEYNEYLVTSVGNNNLLQIGETLTTSIADTNYSGNFIKLLPNIKANGKYTFSVESTELLNGNAQYFSFAITKSDTEFDYILLKDILISKEKQTYTFYAPSNVSTTSLAVILTGKAGETKNNRLKFYRLQLEEGDKASSWKINPAYIKYANNNRIINSYLNIKDAKNNNNDNIILNLSEDIKPNTEYVFSVEKTFVREHTSSTPPKEFTFTIYKKDWSKAYYSYNLPISSISAQYVSFKTPQELNPNECVVRLFIGVVNNTSGNKLEFHGLKLAEGNQYAGWSAASPEEYESLRLLNDAIKGQTDVVGGLVMTNMIQMKNTDGKVTAGVSGILNSGSFINGNGQTIYNGSDNIHFWGGSDLANIQKAPFRVYNNGECYATRFYGFEPAFEINNSNKNKFITNNTIDVDKLGGKVLLNLTNSQLGGSLSFPIGIEYIGAEIEIYNPNMLPFNICSDSLVSPRYATLDNAFDYIETNKITDFTYYHKEITMQGVLHPIDNALRWSIKYTKVCVVERVSPEYSKWKCVKFIPKAANIDGYFNFKGNPNLYYKNYGTTSNPIYILWILKEQRGTGKFKLEF